MQGLKIDPGIIIIIILIIVGLIYWKPLLGLVGKVTGAKRFEEREKSGKEIFYSATRWEALGWSCASCHNEKSYNEFKKTVREVPEYLKTEFRYVQLKDIKKKFNLTILSNEDSFRIQIKKCIEHRLQTAAPTEDGPVFKAIEAYVKTL